MPDSRDDLLAVLLDRQALVSAVADGAMTGSSPRWRRVEVRPVRIKAGECAQVTRLTDTQAFVENLPWDDGSTVEALRSLLDEGFGTWTVQTTTERIRRGRDGVVRRAQRARAQELAHDRAKERLLALDHPVLRGLGITDSSGRVRGSRHDKLRQVDEFLRHLETTLNAAGLLGRDLELVDLGCGNAYLTFAAYAFLSERGPAPGLLGVDTKQSSLDRNRALAATLGIDGRVTFARSSIAAASLGAPDVVMALHACDTATDDAIAAAVRSEARVILASPCCHHDLQAQLRTAPAPYGPVAADPILRERWGDVLTDSVRAEALRLLGFSVDVVEFIDSRHTPRNLLIRARRTGQPQPASRWHDLDRLVAEWRVAPRLLGVLADELALARPEEAV